MATTKSRYTVSVSNEMFEAIEDFRFKNRFQTRSEATVELIRMGLEQLEKESKNVPNAVTPSATDANEKDENVQEPFDRVSELMEN